MPVDVKPLYDNIMKDPDVIPEEGQEKIDLAMSMVLQRATQAVNNEKALSLASSDSSVAKFLDFVTLSKAEDSKWGKGAAEWLRDERGYTDEAIEDMRIKADARQTKSGKRSTNLTLKDAKSLGAELASGAAKIEGWKPSATADPDDDVDPAESPVEEVTKVESPKTWDDISKLGFAQARQFLMSEPGGVVSNAELNRWAELPQHLTDGDIDQDKFLAFLHRQIAEAADVSVPKSAAEPDNDDGDNDDGANDNVGSGERTMGKVQQQLHEQLKEALGEKEYQLRNAGGELSHIKNQRQLDDHLSNKPPPRKDTSGDHIKWDSGNKYNHKLENGSIVRNEKGDLFSVDRLNGYNIELTGINEKGQSRGAKSNVTIDTQNKEGMTKYYPHKIGDIDNHKDLLRVNTQTRMPEGGDATQSVPAATKHKGDVPQKVGDTYEVNGRPAVVRHIFDQHPDLDESSYLSEFTDDEGGGFTSTASKPDSGELNRLKTQLDKKEITQEDYDNLVATEHADRNMTHITEGQGADLRIKSQPMDEAVEFYNTTNKAYLAALQKEMGLPKSDQLRGGLSKKEIKTYLDKVEKEKLNVYTPETTEEQTTTTENKFGGNIHARNYLKEVYSQEGEFEEREANGDFNDITNISSARRFHVNNDSRNMIQSKAKQNEQNIKNQKKREASDRARAETSEAHAYLRENMSEKEYDALLGTGGLGAISNLEQAKQHLIDNPPEDAKPVEAGKEGGTGSTTAGTEENPQGELFGAGTDFSGKTTPVTEGGKGTGRGKGPPIKTGDKPPDDAPKEESEEQKQVRAMVDTATKDGTLRHMFDAEQSIDGKDENPYMTFENYVASKLDNALKKPNISSLASEFGRQFKSMKGAEQAKNTADAKAKDADRKNKANDISGLTDELHGVDRNEATDSYRKILEHIAKYDDSISPANQTALKKAANRLKQVNGADSTKAYNVVQQHATRKDPEGNPLTGGAFSGDPADEHTQDYENDVAAQQQEITDEDDFHEHVSGESGREARMNSFENSDSDRLVHTDKDGKVTHTTLMHANYLGGKKKVKEDAGEAAAHSNDQYDVHGGDENIEGSRPSQSHHDWDTTKRGQHGEVGKDQIKAYKDAAAKMDEAQKAGNSAEEETQKQAMAKLDEESGGALSTMMSDAEKDRQRIERGQPPGPAPRPGLVWAAGIHHWVTPEKLQRIQAGLGDEDGYHVAPKDFAALLGHDEVDPSADHGDGTFGHDGAIHVTKYGAHAVADLHDPNKGVPENMPQNVGNSAKKGSIPHLAMRRLAGALGKAGIMKLKGDGSTDHGESGLVESHYRDPKTGKKTSERIMGEAGEELHGQTSHTPGTDVDEPTSSAYVNRVRDIKNRERIPNIKAKLATAMGRFRAIRDDPVERRKAARAVKHKVGRAARAKARGGMSALRAFDRRMQGEYRGEGLIGGMKITGRAVWDEAKFIGGAMPVVGPEAKVRRSVGAAVSSAKRASREEQKRIKQTEARKERSAVEELKQRTQKFTQKPTEE